MSSKRTTFHWGTYDVVTERNDVVAALPDSDDPDPSPIGDNLVGSLQNKLRIRTPMIREGYLKSRDYSGSGRGREPFVPVSWEYAEKLVAEELNRVRRCYGNEAIFGGSYGWGSAGRFHHAQGQLHRFRHFHHGSINEHRGCSGPGRSDLADSRQHLSQPGPHCVRNSEY